MQYTDPSVSRTKFSHELEGFQKLRDEWRKKGMLLAHADFPIMEFVFTASKLKPPSVVFAVRIDFTNFDAEPLSVKFIDPFTRELVTRKEVPIAFILANRNVIDGRPQFRQQDLLQGLPDEIPFFCIKGIREYHDNPAHTGDSWFLYRNTGIGNLNYILDQLYNHSIISIAGHNVQLQPVITFQQQINLAV